MLNNMFVLSVHDDGDKPEANINASCFMTLENFLARIKHHPTEIRFIDPNGWIKDVLANSKAYDDVCKTYGKNLVDYFWIELKPDSVLMVIKISDIAIIFK